VLDVSLLTGTLPAVVLVVAGLAAAFLLLSPGRRRWMRVLPAVLAGAAVATALVAVVVDRRWRPFPDPLPMRVLVAIGAALAALALAAAGWWRYRWVGRAVGVLAAVAVLIGAALSVNAYFRAYPTLRTALQLAPADEVAFADVPARVPLVGASGAPLDRAWTPPPDMPETGAVAQVDLPGTTSGFPARQAWLYLPPAYLASPRPELPVLVLLAGQPGEPRNWFDGGMLGQRMDAYAADHQGLAPVVVVPDILGSTTANPLCLDSRLGNVATYLRVDVPAWIRAHLQVNPDPRAWAIGGLSAGGTCSLQMAVNAPHNYPTFVDISGQDEPTLGDRRRTVQAAFGGDEAAFAAVNPLDVLAATRFPDSAGLLVAGADDPRYLPQARRVRDAAAAAGMDVRLTVLPGGHGFDVWGPGLSEALPWLGTRLGLTS
jgi:S-formylglutathione hydrolase FrmB